MKKPRLKKRILVAGVALLSLYVLYVVGINILLTRSVFASAFGGEPETIDIHFTRAHSFWPGVIHGEGVSIRGGDSNVEWILKIEEVDFTMKFLPLTHRRFETSKVRGTGITMRARQKLRQPPSDDRVRYLPPIDGLAPWSMRPAGPPSPETWDDHTYKLWSVRLEDVVAEHVHEVWVEHGRFAGDARIEGRFFLHPIREVEIGPAQVDIRDGQLTAGFDTVVASRFVGQMNATVDRFDPRGKDEIAYAAIEDDDLVRSISAKTRLEATFVDAGSLSFLPFRGTTEARALNLVMDKGVLKNGTHVDVDVHGFGYETSQVREINLTANIDNDLLEASTVVHEVKAFEKVRAESASLVLDSRRLDMADKPFADVHAIAQTDAAFVTMPKPVNGEARVRGRAEAWNDTKIAKFDAHADGQALSADLSGKHIVSTIAADGSVAKFKWDEDRIEGVKASADLTATTINGAPIHHVHIDAHSPRVHEENPLEQLAINLLVEGARIDGVLPKAEGTVDAKASFVIANRVATGKATARAANLGWYMEKMTTHANADVALDVKRLDLDTKLLSLGASRVTLTDVRAHLARGDIRAKSFVAAGTAKVIDLEKPDLKTVDAAMSLDGVVMADARVLQSLFSDDSKLVVTSGAATGNAKLVLASDKRGARGRAEVKIARGGVTLDGKPIQGDFDVVANVKDFDAESSTFDMSGSFVSARNVTIGDAHDWWTDVTFDDARVRLDGPEIDTSIAMKAPSAKPIFASFFDGVPGTLAGLAEMPNMRLHGQLRFAPGAIVLSEIDANGGDVTIKGAYASFDDNDKKRGAIVVAKGPLSVGLRIGDSVHPRFFGLADWLKEQTNGVKDDAAKAKGKSLP